jgi:hypothetical protein
MFIFSSYFSSFPLLPSVLLRPLRSVSATHRRIAFSATATSRDDYAGCYNAINSSPQSGLLLSDFLPILLELNPFFFNFAIGPPAADSMFDSSSTSYLLLSTLYFSGGSHRVFEVDGSTIRTGHHKDNSELCHT